MHSHPLSVQNTFFFESALYCRREPLGSTLAFPGSPVYHSSVCVGILILRILAPNPNMFFTIIFLRTLIKNILPIYYGISSGPPAVGVVLHVPLSPSVVLVRVKRSLLYFQVEEDFPLYCATAPACAFLINMLPISYDVPYHSPGVPDQFADWAPCFHVDVHPIEPSLSILPLT